MISAFLLGWSIEKKWIREPNKPVLALFMIGFIGMEVIMVNPLPLNDRIINFANLLFLFSTLLVIAIGIMAFSAIRQKH
jgi:biotin transporter BioY